MTIAAARPSWDNKRRILLDALSARLNPDVAALLPAVAAAAQRAVDASLRPDGTVCDPGTLGRRVTHNIGPVLEHGSRGGWCPRCGESAILDRYDLCKPCGDALEVETL